jgi:sulfur carrier protein ThiS
MKITVKLFGTLSQDFTDYSPEQGLEVEMSEGSKVSDLLVLLKISGSRGGTVVRDGLFLSKEETLTNGSQIQIFQALFGG